MFIGNSNLVFKSVKFDYKKYNNNIILDLTGKIIKFKSNREIKGESTNVIQAKIVTDLLRYLYHCVIYNRDYFVITINREIRYVLTMVNFKSEITENHDIIGKGYEKTNHFRIIKIKFGTSEREFIKLEIDKKLFKLINDRSNPNYDTFCKKSLNKKTIKDIDYNFLYEPYKNLVVKSTFINFVKKYIKTLFLCIYRQHNIDYRNNMQDVRFITHMKTDEDKTLIIKKYLINKRLKNTNASTKYQLFHKRYK